MEPGPLAVEVIARPAAAARRRGRQRQLRQAGVGPVRLGDGVVHRLVVGEAGVEIPPQPAVPDVGVLRHVRLARDREPVAEIAEIVLVRDPADVGAGGPIPAERVLVFERAGGAVLAADLVVFQDVEIQPALVAPAEVTELVLQLHPALGQDPRGDGGVVVGGDVPVVGHGDLGAQVFRGSEAREQKAGLASIGDGKAEIGQVEDRHALERDGGVVGGAQVLGRVELERAHPEKPAVLAGRAGGEARPAQAHQIGAGELDALGVAADKPVRQRVAAGPGVAGVGFELQVQLGGREAVAGGVAQADVAAGVGLVRGLVVTQPVGGQAVAAPFELDVADKLADAARHRSHLARVYLRRRRGCTRRGRPRLQRRQRRGAGGLVGRRGGGAQKYRRGEQDRPGGARGWHGVWGRHCLLLAWHKIA